MKTNHWARAVTLAVLLGALSSTMTFEAHAQKPRDAINDQLLRMGGFFGAHPDLRYRMLGMERYQQGRHEEALKFFRRASRYADKLSQGMVAEMLWNGEGQAQDRALAYAWIDVAAERGYRTLVTQREHYWAALDEEQRARALEVGEAVLAEYGDAKAQARMANVLRRARMNVTGSRTGSALSRSLKVAIPSKGGDPILMTGDDFYAPQLWDPVKYQTWHDDMWEWTEKHTGRVAVGVLQKDSNATPDTPQEEAKHEE